MESSPKSTVTSRTSGAPAGGETSTVNVTGWPTTGSGGLAVTVTGIDGAERTSTAVDDPCRRPAASRTVTVTV